MKYLQWFLHLILIICVIGVISILFSHSAMVGFIITGTACMVAISAIED